VGKTQVAPHADIALQSRTAKFTLNEAARVHQYLVESLMPEVRGVTEVNRTREYRPDLIDFARTAAASLAAALIRGRQTVKG